MRSSSWLVGVGLFCGVAVVACASGEEPGASFNGSGGGSASGGGFGGAGEGGDSSRTANAQSGPGPTSVTSVTSTSGITSSTTATSTSTGDTTTSSSTGEPACQDQGPGEPGNDTLAGAVDLGTIGDSDGDGGQVTGNLREPGDVDWYMYTGEDNLGSSVDPFRQVAGPGIRACFFFQCLDGTAEFDCPSSTVAETEGSLPGCCWNGNQEVNIGGFNCNGPISDDSKVYMKVEHPDGPGCESYTINYHY